MRLLASCCAFLLMLASISVNAGYPGGMQEQRLGGCTAEDIVIVQGAEGPGPDGIPIFRVSIYNLCEKGCAGDDIHVACGWFASATVVDPALFSRVSYDDCVVNGGRPLTGEQVLSFHYANSAPYPLTVSAASFLHCPPPLSTSPSPTNFPSPSPSPQPLYPSTAPR